MAGKFTPGHRTRRFRIRCLKSLLFSPFPQHYHISRHDEVQEQAVRVKRNIQEYADSIHAAFEAKKLEISDDVERRIKASLQEIRKQKEEIEKQAGRHESEIENSETLLKRSTSAQFLI